MQGKVELKQKTTMQSRAAILAQFQVCWRRKVKVTAQKTEATSHTPFLRRQLAPFLQKSSFSQFLLVSSITQKHLRPPKSAQKQLSALLQHLEYRAQQIFLFAQNLYALQTQTDRQYATDSLR
jgi:hypothetical protein